MSLPDPTICPVCKNQIDDDEDHRTPDLTETRYHHECWSEAVNNSGQSFDHRHPSIRTCADCRKTFDYPPSLSGGLAYCDNCAPEDAVAPDYI